MQGSIELKQIAGIMAVLAWPTGVLAQAQGPVGPVQMPPVTVTAQKEPADVQKLPVSVTAVGADTIANAGVSIVSDAAIYAPNTNFTEFTARKLSNATFRGIGSSPANPGITTLIDGVPQLNTNSSNVTLLEVEQIEFVRGPQSALYGRNALGGLVNISTRRPSLSDWSGTALVPFASESGVGLQGSVAGPLKSGKLGFGCGVRLREARRVHDKQRDGQRPGHAGGVRGPGTGRVDAFRRLGNARDRGWRARPRR